MQEIISTLDFSFVFRKQISKPTKKTQDEQAEENPTNEYTEINFIRLNTSSSRNTNIYNEIEQTQTGRLEHSDSVDTGYCDACSVHDVVDSNSSGMNSADNYNMQCEFNCKSNTSINTEQSREDTRNSEIPKQTPQDSLQDVPTVNTVDLHRVVPVFTGLQNSAVVPKREHPPSSHDQPSDIISAENPFNRLNAGLHETIMTDNDTLYNKIPNIIT